MDEGEKLRYVLAARVCTVALGGPCDAVVAAALADEYLALAEAIE